MKWHRFLLVLTAAVSASLIIIWLSHWLIQVSRDVERIYIDRGSTSKEKFNTSLEVTKTIVTSLGTVATIAGGVILYLNFRVANKNLEIAESRLFSERFAKAVELLGNEKIEICLGGLHSPKRMAEESPKDHSAIMNLIVSFIRTRATKLKDEQTLPDSNLKPCIVIQTALSIIAQRNIKNDLENFKIDLSNLDLRGYYFDGKNFAGTCFSDADLRGSKFIQNANLKACSFFNADLRHVLFPKVDLQESDFECADLRGAFFREANLTKTKFEWADLRGACLKDANVQGAYFSQRAWDRENTHLLDLSSTDHLRWLSEVPYIQALTKQQIQSTRNWKSANYYELQFRQELGLLNPSEQSDQKLP